MTEKRTTDAREGFLSTWVKATFEPSALYATSAPVRGRPGPLAFAVVVGMIGTAASALLTAALAGGGLRAFGFLIVSPIGTVASVFLSAAMTHFWLILFRGRNGTFGDTIASVGYAQAPLVFAAVPIVGALVGYIWHMVVLCIGLKHAHKTTTWRAIFAMAAGSPIVFVLAALSLRVAVVEAFKIPAGSMSPSLVIGDHIFVSKLAYGPLIPGTDTRLYSRMPPRRGDVMVFKYPQNKEQDFIKRVIGLAGDHIEVLGGRPIINGWLVPHCKVGSFAYATDGGKWTGDLYIEYLEDQAYFTLLEDGHSDRACSGDGDCNGDKVCRANVCGTLQGPFDVAPSEAWVMGDNRYNSHDSRFWGGLPFENIKGRAMFVWMSFGPGGGIAQDRLWVSLHGTPTLPGGHADLQDAVAKCLHERPPAAATTPPRRAGK